MENEEKQNKKNKHHEAKKEKLLKELQDANEKCLRMAAELQNYKRRKEEETSNLMKYANEDLVKSLLPILDNFERAIKLDDNDLTDELSNFLAGFKMMYASLNEALKKFGVEEISRAGEIFDPSQEQALLTDSLEDHQEDEVLEVLLKGYKLKDRVIRPASVKINQI